MAWLWHRPKAVHHNDHIYTQSVTNQLLRCFSLQSYTACTYIIWNDGAESQTLDSALEAARLVFRVGWRDGVTQIVCVTREAILGRCLHSVGVVPAAAGAGRSHALQPHVQQQQDQQQRQELSRAVRGDNSTN